MVAAIAEAVNSGDISRVRYFEVRTDENGTVHRHEFILDLSAFAKHRERGDIPIAGGGSGSGGTGTEEAGE